MASSGNTFKNSFFGQLKSYGNVVQGVFEQRIARPLLAFKRDLSRPTSENRVSTHQEILSTHRTREESTSSSSPLEIIEIDTSGSFKSIFDKVKNTLSPSTKHRISDETKNSSEENRHSSVSSLSKQKFRKHRLYHNKNVSFAENIGTDSDSDSSNQYSINDRNEIVRNAQTLTNQILIASIDQATTKAKSINKLSPNDDENFERDFRRTIKPRRITSDNKEDLLYQDLSAEIVAYVLKHALRTLKKEQEQLTKYEENEDFIDLK